jgi:DNA-binding response OmpR family regulator
MYIKRQILIVDENPYVVDILVQTLSQDFDITVANTGQEAARLLIQGYRFDSVLTELDLPVFSGLELIKLIRMSKLSVTTPIIVLSHVSDSLTRINCLEQGADSFLSKPFNPLEVKAILFAHIRRADAPDVRSHSHQPIQFNEASRSFWSQGSRILSTLFNDFAIS